MFASAGAISQCLQEKKKKEILYEKYYEVQKTINNNSSLQPVLSAKFLKVPN